MGGDKDKKKKDPIPGWPAPEMEEVKPEQEELITELLDRVVVNPPEGCDPAPSYIADLSDEDKRILGYKFLIARKWKVDDAEKMLRATMEYNAKYKTRDPATGHLAPAFPIRGWDVDAVNEKLGLPCRLPKTEDDRIYKAISPYYQVTWHKWDKLGHPIFYENTGYIKVKPLVAAYKAVTPIGKQYTDPCCDYHVHVVESGIRLREYNDLTMRDELGRRVLGVTAIMDCKNLGYAHLHNPALELLKKIWAMDAEYYPEGIHKIFVVNAPGMINFAYNITKGWLDPRVRGKIVFLKPEKTAEGLLHVVDADNLPEALGGRCCCEGGCIVVPPAPEGGVVESGEGDATVTEEIQIKSGKNETREFALTNGEEVAWEWEVADKNVEFSVHFHTDEEAAEGLDGEEVVPKEKCNAHGSSYTASKEGKLVLVWDNSYSWLNSKLLRLRVFKVLSEEEVLAAEASTTVDAPSSSEAPAPPEKDDDGEKAEEPAAAE